MNRTEWFHKRCVPSLLKLDLDLKETSTTGAWGTVLSALNTEKTVQRPSACLPAESHADCRGDADPALTSCPRVHFGSLQSGQGRQVEGRGQLRGGGLSGGEKGLDQRCPGALSSQSRALGAEWLRGDEGGYESGWLPACL